MTNSRHQTVGLIGLGLMGRAIAGRLIAAGYTVIGYDISNDARASAHTMGVEISNDAIALGKQTDLILLSLFSSGDRRRLMWGEQKLADNLRAGKTVLDTTTASPNDMIEDVGKLQALGIRLVDACISGSSQVVTNGQAVALIGDSATTATYAESLQSFCKAQYYFDTPGNGCRAKLIANVVFGLNRAVLAEALGLADRSGFDLRTMLEVLRNSETYSVAMDTKGPKMIDAAYEPAVARLAQHAKDVSLIQEYSASIGAQTPLTDAHRVIIDETVQMGFGDLDNAAIFEWYRRTHDA